MATKVAGGKPHIGDMSWGRIHVSFRRPPTPHRRRKRPPPIEKCLPPPHAVGVVLDVALNLITPRNVLFTKMQRVRFEQEVRDVCAIEFCKSCSRELCHTAFVAPSSAQWTAIDVEFTRDYAGVHFYVRVHLWRNHVPFRNSAVTDFLVPISAPPTRLQQRNAAPGRGLWSTSVIQ